jgi:CRISPR-associated endonuclease/helicase Cas3
MNAVSGLANALQAPLEQVTPSSFQDMLRIAAFFHDLGKAASGFQEVVTYQGDGKRPKWGYRHEALSAAILLASGLSDQCGLRLLGAVLSHHKTLDHQDLMNCTGAGIPSEVFDATSGRTWRHKVAELGVWWEWVRELVAEAERIGWIPALPHALPEDPNNLPNLYTVNEQLEITLGSVRGINDASLHWILARGLLMGGDHLASARLGVPLTHLSATKIRPPVGFQEKVRDTQGSAILEAPTGSGKTEAALHWALANREGGERIFYILPYQASINKMSQRLERYFGTDSVGILHHRAAMQEFARHFDPEADNYEDARTSATERLDQTRQFYRPVKVMTPYQILKLLFGCRYFEIGLSEMLGGLVIFDEIHAYEPHIAALIELAVERLTALKVRFLFMTATFPGFLKERLQESLGACSHLVVERDHPRDTALLDTARHRLFLHEGTLESCTDQIIARAKTEKVLVVCNRVVQAQALYLALKDKVPSIALLHSRYISRDRLKRENDLVAFPESDDPVMQQIPQASVLVATQVVEVSLNVSFEVCYTEIAPVDALLQRFGRVNRLNQHGQPVEVYVATEFESDRVKFIYSLERIDKTRQCAPEGAKTEDGAALYPVIESEWVRKTYKDGYSMDEQKTYDKAWKAFNQTINNLRPFYTGDDRDFYELFDNYNVVPIRFSPAYKRAVREKRFYIAAQFVASLPKSTFQKMKDWAEWDDENHLYYLNRKYDDDLGLLDEPESDMAHKKEAFEEQCL